MINLKKFWFSIVMWVYQRVLEGNPRIPMAWTLRGKLRKAMRPCRWSRPTLGGGVLEIPYAAMHIFKYTWTSMNIIYKWGMFPSYIKWPADKNSLTWMNGWDFCAGFESKLLARPIWATFWTMGTQTTKACTMYAQCIYNYNCVLNNYIYILCIYIMQCNVM